MKNVKVVEGKIINDIQKTKFSSKSTMYNFLPSYFARTCCSIKKGKEKKEH